MKMALGIVSQTPKSGLLSDHECHSTNIFQPMMRIYQLAQATLQPTAHFLFPISRPAQLKFPVVHKVVFVECCVI
jgi:hypothetical protein